MALWTLPEMLAARPYIGNLTHDVLTERFWWLGGVPRHVFATMEIYIVIAMQW